MHTADGDMIRYHDGRVVAARTSNKGWFPTLLSTQFVREAIWSLPNDAGADDIAREANRRENAEEEADAQRGR